MATRRVFVEASEVPALVVGVARGDAVALRRVLGARRAGRIGVALGIAGLVLAFPPGAWLWISGAQLIAGFAGTLARPRLTWQEHERLSLWLGGPALVVTAALRLTPLELMPLFVAVWLGAHGLLWYYLRRGLGESLSAS